MTIDGCVANVTRDKGHFHLLNDSENIVELGHETGIATGLSLGVATIEGEYNADNQVTTSLTVIGEEVARVQISPIGPLAVGVGDNINLTCEMQQISGNELLPEENITDLTSWSINDSSIASLGANSVTAQVVQGVTLGSTTALCQYGGKKGFMTIVVQ